MDIAALNVEVRNLRKAFEDHETRDETRFSDVRDDMKEHSKEIGVLQSSLSNIKGRLTVLGVAAIALIPVLTEVVHAWVGPHVAVK